MAKLLNLVCVPLTCTPHAPRMHPTCTPRAPHMHLTCTPDQQLRNALGNADAQKQASALQEQLSQAEANNAAEVQKLQQAESKLRDDIKQARLDNQQVLIDCCSPTLPQLAGKDAVPFMDWMTV